MNNQSIKRIVFTQSYIPNMYKNKKVVFKTPEKEGDEENYSMAFRFNIDPEFNAENALDLVYYKEFKDTIEFFNLKNMSERVIFRILLEESILGMEQ